MSDASSTDNDAQSIASASKSKVKKRGSLTTVAHAIRDLWANIDAESLVFDPRSVAQSFLATTTHQFQYLPIPHLPPSAAPPVIAIRDKSSGSGTDDEDDESKESKESKSSEVESGKEKEKVRTDQLSTGAMNEAKRLLVDSSPSPPSSASLPDSAALLSSISSASSVDSSLSQASNAASTVHLASVTVALTTGLPVPLPRSLPSLAFLEFYHRREHVLRHILFMTAVAERKILDAHPTSRQVRDSETKQKKSAKSLAATVSGNNGAASPLLRMTILSLFPVIQSLSRKDAALLSSLLNTLLSLLQSLPLLSLQQESSDCIDAFRSLLHRMAIDDSNANVGDALTALIGLALAEGKLRHALHAIVSILKLSTVTAPFAADDARSQSLFTRASNDSDVQLSIASFLSQLHDVHEERSLPRLDSTSFADSFQHASPDVTVTPQARAIGEVNRSASASPRQAASVGLGIDIPFLGSVATDGTLLFVVNEFGLQSVGSGRRGSLARLIYSENDEFHAQIGDRAKKAAKELTKDAAAAGVGISVSEKKVSKDSLAGSETAELRSGTLLYVNDRLFYAAPNFEVVARAATEAQRTAAPFILPVASAQIVEIDPATLQPVGDIAIMPHSKQLLPLYVSICTDGRSIYALHRFTPPAKKSSKLSTAAGLSAPLSALFQTPNQVDVYALDGQSMVYQRTIALDESSADTAATIAGDRSSASAPVSVSTPYMCYCTGTNGYIARIALPSRSTSSYSVSVKHDLFSIETGQLMHRSLSTTQTLGHGRGTSVTYDPVNNCVWQYQPNTFLVQAWNNLTVTKTAVSDGPVTMIIGAETFIGVLEQLCGAVPSVRFIEYTAADSSYHYDSAYRSTLSASGRVEVVDTGSASSLTVDSHADTFAHLDSILTITAQALDSGKLSSEDATRISRILLSALTVLRVNLDQLTSPFDDEQKTIALGGVSSTSVISAKLAAHLRIRLLQFTRIRLIDARVSQTIHDAALNAIIRGLPHLFAGYTELDELLREPFLSSDTFVDQLARYEGVCIIVGQSSNIADQLGPEGVIPTLLRRSVEHSAKQLLSLRSQPRRSPLLTPTLKLLAAIQRSLLSRIEEACTRPHVIHYTQLLLTASVAFIEQVNVVASQNEERESLEHIVRNSLVGVLLPTALATVTRRDLLARLDYPTLKSLMSITERSTFSSLFLAVDAFVGTIALSQEKQFFQSSPAPARRLIHLIESSHPYDSRRMHHVLSFPHCNFLIVHFDPRSSIDRQDSLMLTNQAGELKAGAVTGAAFPRHPLIVSGDSLVVTFNPDSQAGHSSSKRDGDRPMHWGFRMVIHGVKLAQLTQQGFALDLCNSLAISSARIVHAGIFPSSVTNNVEDTHTRALLNEELMTGGLLKPRVTNTDTTATRSKNEEFLLALTGDRSPANEWLEFMAKKVTGRPPLSAAAKKAIGRVERVLLATLLHHADAVSAAINVAQELAAHINSDLAVAHPDFPLLQPVFKQLWSLDAGYLSASRVEKRWQDLMATSLSDASQEIRGLQLNDLTQLCAAKGVPVERNDSGVTAQRLIKRLATEMSKLGRVSQGSDLWQIAYANVAQQFTDRCQLLLALRNPSASYPASQRVGRLSLMHNETGDDDTPSASNSATPSEPGSPGFLRSYTDQLKRTSSTVSARGDGGSLPLSRVNSQSGKQLNRAVLGRPTLESQSPVKSIKSAVDSQSSFQQWKQREKAAQFASMSQLSLARQSRSSTQEKRLKAIGQFLSAPASHTEPAAITAAIEQRQQFAQARFDGLLLLTHLLAHAHLDSERNSLLLGIGDGVRKYWTSADGTPTENRSLHFLHGLNGIGPELTAQLRQAWFKLVEALVAIINQDCHTSTKLLAIDALGLHYTPDDSSALAESGLFAALRAVLANSLSFSLATAARSLFCQLAAICLWWTPAQIQSHTFVTAGSTASLASPRPSFSALSAPASSLLALQNELFATVFDQMTKEMAKLADEQKPSVKAMKDAMDDRKEARAEEKEHEEKSSSSSSSSPEAAENRQVEEVMYDVDRANETLASSAEVDSACYQLLTLLFQLRQSYSTKSFLARNIDALFTLLSLSQPSTSTLRIQRLSLRLVRFMLTDSEIASKLIYTLRTAASTPITVQGNGKEAAIIGAMMDRIGELVTGASASATINADVTITPRKLSVDHSHSHTIKSPLSASATSASDLHNLIILNTETESSSSTSNFVNSVLSGLKDLLKSKTSKSDLRAQLGSASLSGTGQPINQLTILTGTKEEMNRIARQCAKRSFCVQIAPAPVQDGFLRNQRLEKFNPSAIQCGEISLALASELVTLVRVLAASPLWSEHVEAAVGDRVKALDHASTNLMSSASPASLAAAPLSALSVLGGFKEPLRLGGRVRVSSDDSEESVFGTVVAYQRGDSHAEVVLEDEQDVSSIEVFRLAPAPTSYTAAPLLRGNESATESILSFLKRSHEQLAAATQDDSTVQSERIRLAHQLNLFALRSLCAIIDDCPEVAARLGSNSALLSFLIETAKKSQPSSNHSQLEDQVQRAHERFLSLLSPPVYPTTHTASAASVDSSDPSAALPHFPFASQAKRLPTAFITEFARFLIFEDSQRRVCQFTKDASHGSAADFTLSRGGAGGVSSALRRIEDQLRADTSDEYLILANAGVPVTLPVFYFEVELLTSNPISIGFAPHPRSVTSSVDVGGMELEQLSAAHPSYARLHSMIKSRINNSWPEHSIRFSGRDGRWIRKLNHHDNGSNYHSAGFGTKGDVVGCHWNLQDGQISFTKNGESLGQATIIQATSTSNGQAIKYFPAVGFVQAGTRVKINFGSEPFAFALSAELSKAETEAERQERLARAAAAESLQKEAEEAARTRAEVEKVARQAARDDMAQQLLDMCFGLLPSHRHALKALELHRDNAQAAANFIFENEVVAIQEINRLIREEDAAAKRDAEKKEREEKETADKEKREKARAEAKTAETKTTEKVTGKDSEAPLKYDWHASSSLILGTAYSRPVVDDGSDVDPAEEQWLAETEALLRSARLFPSEGMLQAIMEQLRQGGDSRANAILSLPISIPPPQQKTKEEESKVIVNAIKIEDTKVGLRVKVSANAVSSKDKHGVSTAAAAAAATSSSTSAVSASSSSASAVWLLPSMAAVMGRCGVVTSVDSDSELCRVQFVDTESSSVSEWWLPIAHLEHVDTDSNAWIGWEKLSDLRSPDSIQLLASLTQLYARKAVLLILQQQRHLSIENPEVLQLISAEMLPSIVQGDSPTLTDAMQEIVDRTLQSQPLLPARLLDQIRSVIANNSFALDSNGNTGDEKTEWDEDGKAVNSSDTRALSITFNHNTRLPRSNDSLAVYDSDLSAVLKQWRGGEKGKATPLLPVVLDMSAIHFMLKKEKATSKSTQVRVEVNGVPHTFSLAQFILQQTIRQCIDSIPTSNWSNKASVNWSGSLVAAVQSIAAMLALRSLSPLLKQSLFVLLTRSFHAFRSLRQCSEFTLPELDIHTGALYLELIQLYENSKKDGKVALVSVYFQSLCEFLSTVRRTLGEKRFSTIVEEARKGSSSAATKKSKGSTKPQPLLTPSKPPPLLSKTTSSSSSASSVSAHQSPPRMLQRSSRLGAILNSPPLSQAAPPAPSPYALPSVLPSSSSSAVTSPTSMSHRGSESDRSLREMMAQMSSLLSPAGRIALQPVSSASASRPPIPLVPPPPASASTASSSHTESIAAGAASPVPSTASSASSGSSHSSISTPSSSRPSTARRQTPPNQVQQLVAMGFDSINAEAALTHFGSFAQSLDALMGNWRPAPESLASPLSQLQAPVSPAGVSSLSIPQAHSPAANPISSPAESLRSLSSSPSLQPSREDSEREFSRSQLSSSLSLESAAGSVRGADGAESVMDELDNEERYHIESNGDDSEDEEEALMKAISLSLQAGQEDEKEEKGEEKSSEPEPALMPVSSSSAPDALVSQPPTAESIASPEPATVLATPAKTEATSPRVANTGVRIPTEAWFDDFCLVSDTIDALFTHVAALPVYLVNEAAIDTTDRARLRDDHSSWTLLADAELLALANQIEEQNNIKLTAVDKYQRVSDLLPLIREVDTNGYQLLQSRPPESLAARLLLFRLVNLKLVQCLALIDLTRASSNDECSLGYRLSFCRNLLLPSVKFDFIDACLELTTREKATSKPRVIVDRQTAAASMKKDGESSVFVQCFKQLGAMSVAAFKQPPTKGQTYTVIDIKFRGEHVVGEGGPYRQLFNDICRELQTQRPLVTGVSDDSDSKSKSQTSLLSLLMPSANRSGGRGEHRDKFIPVPSSTSSQHLSQFEFFGKLLGIAFRTNVLMPLDLPSFFFKPLVNQQLTIKDLENIDSAFVNGVLTMLHSDDHELFQQHFGDSLTWTTTLSDATTVELKPSGSSLPVSFSSRLDYAALAEQARLNESRAQLKAIHRGLVAMVPESLLSLLTWSELERRVCGQPVIDIPLLKRHTEYIGCTEQSPHVQFFWQVMDELSQPDRRKFITFCSGSERLPSSDEDFTRGGAKVRLLIKEAMTKKGENVDARFLRSDTCFFNLELPAYSSAEVMRRQIQAVISIDVGMNADDDHTQLSRSGRHHSHRNSHRSHHASSSSALQAREIRASEAFEVGVGGGLADEMQLHFDDDGDADADGIGMSEVDGAGSSHPIDDDGDEDIEDDDDDGEDDGEGSDYDDDGVDGDASQSWQ